MKITNNPGISTFKLFASSDLWEIVLQDHGLTELHGYIHYPRPETVETDKRSEGVWGAPSSSFILTSLYPTDVWYARLIPFSL